MVEITAMTRTEKLVGKKKQTRLLAFFDVVLSEVRLKGCALVVYKNGKATTWPPKVDPRPDARCAVHIIDDTLVREITDKALSAFYAIGGDDELVHPVD
jgi:hypothetical protein